MTCEYVSQAITRGGRRYVLHGRSGRNGSARTARRIAYSKGDVECNTDIGIKGD